MTHIIFVSPENRDSRVQMQELAGDIYVSNTKEHYYNVDIAEIPQRHDIEGEGSKMASFIKGLGLQANPAEIIIVAYEDYSFVALNALQRLKISPLGLLIVNFPLSNEKLFEWEEFGYMKSSINNSDSSKGNMYCFQGDYMRGPVYDYLREKGVKAEVVRVKNVTSVSDINYNLFSVIKKLLA